MARTHLASGLAALLASLTGAAIVLAAGVAPALPAPAGGDGSGGGDSVSQRVLIDARMLAAVSDRAPLRQGRGAPALFARAVGDAGTPRITFFTAIPATLPASGGRVRLLANVQNAATCRFSAKRHVTVLRAARACSSGAASLEVKLARNASRAEQTYAFKLSVSGRNNRKTTLRVLVRERARASKGVTVAPAITTQPASQTVAAGTSATFTAGASGNPTATVRWQLSVNGGASWGNIAGATSRTYSATVNSGENGYEYRAVFANAAGAATTNAATLTVTPAGSGAPAVTTEPTNQVVLEGNSARLGATASGNPAPSVQWQVSNDDGASWSNIANATSASYSFTASPSENGYEYRALFTNALASTATTAATLIVEADASSNWSGYLATAAAGTFKSVSGSWTVPSVSCAAGATDYSSQWIGIDGGTDNQAEQYQTVEQDGTAADCSSGTPFYYAWYELYGDDSPSVNGGDEVELPPSSYPVSAGDVMSASVSVTGTTWTLTIADTTHPWSGGPFSTAVVWSGGEQASAEWIVERPALCNGSCSLAALSDFATVSFTGATATTAGAPESISAVGGQSIEMVGQGDDALAGAGMLNPTGEGFTDTWFASD